MAALALQTQSQAQSPLMLEVAVVEHLLVLLVRVVLVAEVLVEQPLLVLLELLIQAVAVAVVLELEGVLLAAQVVQAS
jgi:hypothetical protein